MSLYEYNHSDQSRNSGSLVTVTELVAVTLIAMKGHPWPVFIPNR
jgi:hypothetical protein